MAISGLMKRPIASAASNNGSGTLPRSSSIHSRSICQTTLRMAVPSPSLAPPTSIQLVISRLKPSPDSVRLWLPTRIEAFFGPSNRQTFG
ncbi:hypothetical protein D3C78_1834620 [compost metagenome]